MQLKEVKGFISFVMKRDYNAGRMSASDYSGWKSYAVPLGGLIATVAVGSGLVWTAATISLPALAAAGAVSWAAASALVGIPLFLMLTPRLGAMGFGFLKAVQEKFLPSFSPKRGIEKSASFMKDTFTFKHKPSADFKKSASVAKPADTTTPTPPACGL